MQGTSSSRVLLQMQVSLLSLLAFSISISFLICILFPAQLVLAHLPPYKRFIKFNSNHVSFSRYICFTRLPVYCLFQLLKNITYDITTQMIHLISAFLAIYFLHGAKNHKTNLEKDSEAFYAVLNILAEASIYSAFSLCYHLSDVLRKPHQACPVLRSHPPALLPFPKQSTQTDTVKL